MSNSDNFKRKDDEICMFCQASPYTSCSADCPCNFGSFGINLPDPLRSLITTELVKQAEFIYEKKQMDWMNQMLTERIGSVMKDWPLFMDFIKILHRLDYFETINDIINYLEAPDKRQKIFILWQEMGTPVTEGTKSFEMFRKAALNMRKEDGGRVHTEEE